MQISLMHSFFTIVFFFFSLKYFDEMIMRIVLWEKKEKEKKFITKKNKIFPHDFFLVFKSIEFNRNIQQNVMETLHNSSQIIWFHFFFLLKWRSHIEIYRVSLVTKFYFFHFTTLGREIKNKYSFSFQWKWKCALFAIN